MQPLSTRTEHFTDSVIRRMTRVSAKYGAINLSQGYPDFNPPSAILDRLAEVSHENFHQYSITWGAQNFREALAEKQSRLMGRQIDPNTEIVTTCGSTEAMMAAMMTVANPGDKVIVFSPFYENYGADTILSGAEPIYVPLHPPLFNFNVDELEAAFRQHPGSLSSSNRLAAFLEDHEVRMRHVGPGLLDDLVSFRVGLFLDILLLFQQVMGPFDFKRYSPAQFFKDHIHIACLDKLVVQNRNRSRRRQHIIQFV